MLYAHKKSFLCLKLRFFFPWNFKKPFKYSILIVVYNLPESCLSMRKILKLQTFTAY